MPATETRTEFLMPGDDELTLTELLRWQLALSAMLATVRRRFDRSWDPAWGSQAARELRATSPFTRSDDTPWGEDPLATAFTVAGLACEVALESTDAVQVLLCSRPASVIAMDTLARAALEAASQAWWLLDPAIGGRARIVRLYLLRRSSAVRLSTTADQLGASDLHVEYGSPVEQLDAFYLGILGLKKELNAKGKWAGCEGQRPFNYTARAAKFMEEILDGEQKKTAKGPYAYFSGGAHVELWRILQGRYEAPGTDGRTVLTPHVPLQAVRSAVATCVDAVLYPAMRAAHLLGWGAALTQLDALLGPLNAALGSAHP